MLCPICNTPNRENARFCKGCGYSFPQEVVEVTAGQDAIPQPQSSVPQPSPVATQPPPLPVESSADDPSLAPTMILTPQEMMAYHARRWQQEMTREQQAAVMPQTTEDIADAATMRMTPVAVPPDIADMPTVMMAPQMGDNEPTIIMPPAPPAQAAAPPPPPESLATDAHISATSPYADQMVPASVSPIEQDLAAVPQAVSGGQNVEQAAEQQPETPAVAANAAEIPTAPSAATTDFPALAVGTLVAGRYEVTQALSEDGQERTYQVTDRQGYKHCWNCGSEQNAEGDEFCIDCGAELLNGSYTMHEFTAAANKQSDSRVVPSNIINTFIDQGKTYAIEQAASTQSAFPNGVHLLAACESDAGNVRRSEPNEDSTLVLHIQRVHESISAPSGVFIVADGLGGHDNGQVASRLAIDVISERIIRDFIAPPLVSEKAGEAPKVLDEAATTDLIRSTIEDANAALVQVNQRDKTDMGSTLTGFMIVGEHAYIINIGDSRTYMLREDNLYQLTTDHSLVGQLVAGGLIEPDDVYTHPQRSQIYRSLGDKQKIQVDITKQQVVPGDILLSCSDGLWEMVRNPQIKDILNKAPDPQTACSRLLEAANNNGGEDNVSAVVVFVR